MPTGFIHIYGSLPLDVCQRFCNRLRHGLAHAVFLGRNTPQANLYPEDRFQRFLDVPLADPKPPPEIAYRRLQTFSKTAFGHICWPLGLVVGPTSATSQTVQLIFNYLGFDLGQFNHLMSSGLPVFSQQQGPTVFTSYRFAHYNTVHLLRRFQLPPFSSMPFLSAFLLPTGFLFWVLALIRRIRRWRFGRVFRILVDLLSQFRHFRFQAIHLFLQTSDLLLEHLVPLPQRNYHHLYRQRSLLPSFLRDWQTRRQLHAYSLLPIRQFSNC
jgi:hypothetical protein